YGGLGALLAQESRARAERWGPKLERTSEGIRATVIGAAQYTTQVSGSTIYVSPLAILPLRNVPVIAPSFALEVEEIEPSAVAEEIQALLKRLDLADAGLPVPGVRALARLGHVSPARCVLPGSDGGAGDDSR